MCAEKHHRVLALSVLCVLSLCLPIAIAGQVHAPTGLWDGSIQSRAGEVNFGVVLTQQGSSVTAVLVNATDRQPFSSVAWNGQTLTLGMDYYDGHLTLHYATPLRMEGEYSRLTSKGMVHIPVTLVPHDDLPATKQWIGQSLAGDWLLREEGAEGAEKNTLTNFQQEKTATSEGKAAATGILEPVSGDTGLLHGFVSTDANGQTHFHLSRFDGIHVLALDGEFTPDGSLKGQIGGVKSLSPFTAVRTTDKAAADPNTLAGTLTKVKDPQEPFRFSGVDTSGKTIDQNSLEFKGKPMIVDIFGTWCPNCHDEVCFAIFQRFQKSFPKTSSVVGLSSCSRAAVTHQGHDQLIVIG